MEIRMEVSNISKYRKLTKEDRILIAQWKNKGYSNSRIAKWLGRDKSTIGRELKNNSFEGKIYEPLHADYEACERKLKAWGAKHPLKNEKIYEYTLDRLRGGWSPEQIAGRLKLEHPSNDDSWHICAETIYAFIYSDNPLAKKLRLWEYLRRKQGRRRQKGGRKSVRIRIPERVSIHERPDIINFKGRLGDFEGDSIEGKGHKSGLHTEYERVTSLTLIEKLERVDSLETIKAQLKIFGDLPEEIRRSTTLDNGSEMVKHYLLRKVLGMDTYFADPYSSWQRGGNENANLWIRYYFPKGTDFSTVSEDEIKAVEWELNNRPRKRLGFKIPMEKMKEYLKGLH